MLEEEEKGNENDWKKHCKGRKEIRLVGKTHKIDFFWRKGSSLWSRISISRVSEVRSSSAGPPSEAVETGGRTKEIGCIQKVCLKRLLCVYLAGVPEIVEISLDQTFTGLLVFQTMASNGCQVLLESGRSKVQKCARQRDIESKTASRDDRLKSLNVTRSGWSTVTVTWLWLFLRRWRLSSNWNSAETVVLIEWCSRSDRESERVRS
jgi:hypothetical protein